MSNVLKISEAAAMGLHAGMYLASHGGRAVTVREMADALRVSEHHLAKVMGRLVKTGLVKSERGPSGGFTLGREAQEVTLLMVYEAIDGPIAAGGCLMSQAVCESEHCMLGDLIGHLNLEVREYLAGATLAQYKDQLGPGPGRDQDRECEHRAAAK